VRTGEGESGVVEGLKEGSGTLSGTIMVRVRTWEGESGVVEGCKEGSGTLSGTIMGFLVKSAYAVQWNTCTLPSSDADAISGWRLQREGRREGGRDGERTRA